MPTTKSSRTMTDGFLSIVTTAAILLAAACQHQPNPATGDKKDSASSFGDSLPIANSLLGRVYLLPDTTRRLPDFDTLQPQDNPIYAGEINIPWQKWSSGFPGLRGRFEWFGIEYTGTFRPNTAGKYLFKLISDDGSKLWIDDTLRIDDDGIHSEWAGKDSVYLSAEFHTIKLDYFQGPRYELALQLFWSRDSLPQKIFPGKDFVLHAPKPHHAWWWLLIIATILLAALLIWWKKKKEQNKVKI